MARRSTGRGRGYSSGYRATSYRRAPAKRRAAPRRSAGRGRSGGGGQTIRLVIEAAPASQVSRGPINAIPGVPLTKPKTAKH